jgi:hypothetical protein
MFFDLAIVMLLQFKEKKLEQKKEPTRGHPSLLPTEKRLKALLQTTRAKQKGNVC